MCAERKASDLIGIIVQKLEGELMVAIQLNFIIKRTVGINDWLNFAYVRSKGVCKIVV